MRSPSPIVAIARNEEVARLYILAAERQRIKFLNKYQMLSEAAKTPMWEAHLDALREELTRRIKEEEIAELSTHFQDFAEHADLKDLYNSAYAVLSESVHANVRDLDSLLKPPGAGEIVHLRYEAETADLDVLLGKACEAVLGLARHGLHGVENERHLAYGFLLVGTACFGW